jgi:hypothetical protein
MLFAGRSDGTVVPVQVGSAVGTPVSMESTPKAAPLLASDGNIYIVTDNGTLEVRSKDALATLGWKVTRFGHVEASPTVDCNRDHPATDTTVMYIGNMTGEVFAVLIDADSIDVDAPWPKYQHDPRNTGNSATPLDEFRCQ